MRRHGRGWRRGPWEPGGSWCLCGPWRHPAGLGEACGGRWALRAPHQVPTVVPGLLNPHREVMHGGEGPAARLCFHGARRGPAGKGAHALPTRVPRGCVTFPGVHGELSRPTLCLLSDFLSHSHLSPPCVVNQISTVFIKHPSADAAP